MTPDRWQQLEELYDAVRDLPETEKNAVLGRAKPDLRENLEAILRQDGSALDHPVWVGREGLIQTETVAAGTVLRDGAKFLVLNTTPPVNARDLSVIFNWPQMMGGDAQH